MATRAKKQDPVDEPEVKKPTTAIVKWEEELAKQAAVASGMEDSTATGQFFSTKSGILAFNDAPLPGNEMAVIILDAILENVFYEGKYDPDSPQGPTCFAFGRDEKAMAPHKVVFENETQQSGTCIDCPMNEWASAETGRGKACRNTRRLAMIPAGTFDRDGKFKAFEDEDHFASAGIAFMKLPVTSVKAYAAFVKQVAGALKRPPHAIFTRVKVVPDPKTQFKVLFEPLKEVPNDLLGSVMARHNEAQALIEFPYTPFDEDAAPAPAPRRASKAAKPVGKSAGAKAGRKY